MTTGRKLFDSLFHNNCCWSKREQCSQNKIQKPARLKLIIISWFSRPLLDMMCTVPDMRIYFGFSLCIIFKIPSLCDIFLLKSSISIKISRALHKYPFCHLQTSTSHWMPMAFVALYKKGGSKIYDTILHQNTDHEFLNLVNVFKYIRFIVTYYMSWKCRKSSQFSWT